MDGIGFVLLLLFVFIGMPFIFGFLIYFIPKKLGYPKTAKWLIGIYCVLVGVFIITTIFEDELFTKNEAKKLIAEQNITLKDNFKISRNESMSSIGDYYHKFILTISEKDKQQIINSIKSDFNFKRIGEEIIDYRFSSSVDKYEGSKSIQNFETEKEFIRELYIPKEKGYTPTFRRITIDKIGNTLVFEDIDD